MSKNSTIPVQIDSEFLCCHTLKITNNLNNFPKKYRFTLVDRILSITFDIHDKICDANNTFCKDERIRYLDEVISCCRKLKFYIRLTYEVLSPKCSVVYWDNLVSNIETQVVNWKRSIK